MTTFGDALNRMIRHDHYARRATWAPHMKIYIARGRYGMDNLVKKLSHIDGIPQSLFNGDSNDGVGVRHPALYQVLESGHVSKGWFPSTIDMLAEDWETSAREGDFHA